MRTTVLTIAALLLGTASAAIAQDYQRCDSYDNCRGVVNGQPFSTRTDSQGNTRGTVGNQSVGTRTDGYGNTRGDTRPAWVDEVSHNGRSC